MTRPARSESFPLTKSADPARPQEIQQDSGAAVITTAEVTGKRFGVVGTARSFGCGSFDWWCALPDTEAASRAALLLRGAGEVLACHGSGRPWLIGEQRLHALHLADVGPTRVAVVGECLAALDRFIPQTNGDADRLMAALLSLPGSFHTVTTGPAGLVAAGDVTGFRRLFSATTNAVTLIASHADVLRRLLDAPINRTWLAAKLASPEAPSVLRNTLSPFTGVTPIPPGYRIQITDRGSRASRWWTPPEARQPRASGAPVLCATLTEAVARRIDHPHGSVSVQVSGGLDSTTLAFLARSAHPLLITTAGRSVIDDDLAWARRVADLLKAGTHRVISSEDAHHFSLIWTSLSLPWTNPHHSLLAVLASATPPGCSASTAP